MYLISFLYKCLNDWSSGNVIYESGVFSRILVDDGYITMSATTPTYHYYILDHQGNNRVVFNQNGTIEQTNHYYPFGMTFGEGIDNSDNRYKYNGKELDRMHGLDLYDYGARHYDAAIGRWGVIDPLAEKYYWISPYVYCANNPIRFIDPDGKQVFIPLAPPAPAPVIPPSNMQSVGQSIGLLSTGAVNYVKQSLDNLKTFAIANVYVAYNKNNGQREVWKEQQKRDRDNKNGLDNNQAEFTKSVKDNVSGNMPNGDPDVKRNPKGPGAILIAVGLGSELVKEHSETTKPDVESNNNKEKVDDKKTKSETSRNSEFVNMLIEKNIITVVL